MSSIAAFLLRHAAIGFGAATIFVVAIVIVDPGGMGRLLWGGAEHPLPLVLLWSALGLTFVAAQSGVVVRFPTIVQGKPRRGHAILAPIPVRIRGRR